MNFYVKTFTELSGTEVYEILKSRAAVFTMEQQIRYLDMDDTDYQSLHCFFEQGGKVIAYLRAFTEAAQPHCFHIGRVLTVSRGVGLGRELMENSMDVLRKKYGCRKILLHSQVSAVGFYEKIGFCTVGETFMEAGVSHIAMERVL